MGLGETQGELKVTKEMLQEMKEKMIELKNRLAIAEQKLMETGKDEVFENEASILGDTPYLHQCGFHSRAGFVDSIMSFECLSYDVTNQPTGLDWETGVFTCPYPGTYTVSWSWKNEAQIHESFHQSYFREEGATGVVADFGGKTILVGLEAGDTLDLYCINCAARLWNVQYCISLTTPDSV